MADAIRVLLRLLVERPNHSGVRRALAEVRLISSSHCPSGFITLLAGF